MQLFSFLYCGAGLFVAFFIWRWVSTPKSYEENFILGLSAMELGIWSARYNNTDVI